MSAALQISERVLSAFNEAGLVLKPPPKLAVSEWAEQHFILSSEDSAIPGRYRTDVAPFQAEMLDCIADPAVEEVTFQCAAQIAKTVVMKIWIAYFMKEDPSSMMLLLPDVELAKRVSRQRLAPMFRDVPILRGLLDEGGLRRSGTNLLLEKSFPGGVLFLVGSNSPAALSSVPVRILFVDEANRLALSAGSEGSPLQLGKARTTTFWNRRIAKASTPTDEHGVITAEYEQSDMRRFFVPCPECTDPADLVHYRDYAGWDEACARHEGPPSGYQVLEFKNGEEKRLIIDKDWPQSGGVYYACSACGAALTEQNKSFMLRHGHWHALRPEITNHRGYQLSALYSPFMTWEEVAKKWRDAMAHREDKNRLQVFVNTVLAEPYSDDSEELDGDELAGRVEDYPCAAPDGVTVITAAVDVQIDRLELLVRGWGKGQESWLIDKKVFEGDTSKLGAETIKPSDGSAAFTREGPWERLDGYLMRASYMHQRGVRLPIACTFIDSGDQTTVVYEFVKPRASRWIYAIKGISGFGKPPLGQPTKNNRARVRLYPIAVDEIKATIHRRLSIGTPGAGYLHFNRAHCDQEYFRQLTAERIKRKPVRGYKVRYWEKLPGRRNEALDMEVYAYAAFLRLGENSEQLLEKLREQLLERAKFAAVERRSKTPAGQLPLIDSVPADPRPAKPSTAELAETLGALLDRGEKAPDLAQEFKVAEKEPEAEKPAPPEQKPVVIVKRGRWL